MRNSACFPASLRTVETAGCADRVLEGLYAAFTRPGRDAGHGASSGRPGGCAAPLLDGLILRHRLPRPDQAARNHRHRARSSPRWKLSFSAGLAGRLPRQLNKSGAFSRPWRVESVGRRAPTAARRRVSPAHFTMHSPRSPRSMARSTFAPSVNA